jgi:hypothetical protein
VNLYQLSKITFSVAKKRRRFLYLERVTIAEWQGTSEDQKDAAKLT